MDRVGERRWSGRILGMRINKGRGQRIRGEGDEEKTDNAEVEKKQ